MNAMCITDTKKLKIRISNWQLFDSHFLMSMNVFCLSSQVVARGVRERVGLYKLETTIVQL